MTRNNTGQKTKVIIDDARQNRLRSHIDEPGTRLTQQQQQKQKAFLVRLHHRARVNRIDGHGRHDHDGLRVLTEALNRFPQRHQFFLELIEFGLGIRSDGWFAHRRSIFNYLLHQPKEIRNPKSECRNKFEHQTPNRKQNEVGRERFLFR